MDQSSLAEWNQLDLGDLLVLDQVDESRFRNRCSEDNRNGRVFGGQLLAQALLAAQRDVAGERHPSSLQVIFMHGAGTAAAVDYLVEPLQDGKRFSSRRVVAKQAGREAISAHVTFAEDLEAAGHLAIPRMQYPAPDQLAAMSELASQKGGDFAGIDWANYEKPCLELRIVDPEHHLTGRCVAPRMAFWVRLRVPLDDAPHTHNAALAYLSDYWINSAAITHHIPARDAHAAAYIASLNHSLWFHASGRADGWLLFECESGAMQQGRALSQARIYDAAGVLLASVAQECLFVNRQQPA
ncbi:MAG: acyl-CoA thioesterase domain-containing protein [Pseudomonadota bacterium]